MSKHISYQEYLKISKEAEIKLVILQRQIIIENKIRGVCLTISADMEALLLRIMLYCRIEVDELIEDFTKKSLDWKLDNARADLQKYDNSLYQEMKEDFKELERIVKLRNKIAHCPFIWEGDDLSFVKILIWRKSKGNYKPYLVKLKTSEFDSEMLRFQDLIFKMLHACRHIETKIKKLHPHLVNLFEN